MSEPQAPSPERGRAARAGFTTSLEVALAALVERLPRRGVSGRLVAAARIGSGTAHGQPRAGRLVAATAASLVVSLLLDAALVAAGEAVFPSTKGFSHFRVYDYGALTVLGVLVACAGWAVVTRLSYAPRWLFARLAVLVSLVLFLPDAWILARGEPPPGVAVLAVMHVAIALVTYNALVRLAPVRAPAERGAAEPPRDLPPVPPGAGGEVATARLGADGSSPTRGSAAERRAAWVLLDCLVGAELVLGFAALALVPFGRPSGWVPQRGSGTYLVHGVLGSALGAGAVWLVAATRRSTKIRRVAAVLGLVGVALAGLGGLLTVAHGLRLLGAGLMLVGAGLAGCAYLMPLLETPAPPAAEGAAESLPAGRDQDVLQQ